MKKTVKNIIISILLTVSALSLFKYLKGAIKDANRYADTMETMNILGNYTADDFA